jgi:hypothetical protein
VVFVLISSRPPPPYRPTVLIPPTIVRALLCILRLPCLLPLPSYALLRVPILALHANSMKSMERAPGACLYSLRFPSTCARDAIPFRASCPIRPPVDTCRGPARLLSLRHDELLTTRIDYFFDLDRCSIDLFCFFPPGTRARTRTDNMYIYSVHYYSTLPTHSTSFCISLYPLDLHITYLVLHTPYIDIHVLTYSFGRSHLTRLPYSCRNLTSRKYAFTSGCLQFPGV